MRHALNATCAPCETRSDVNESTKAAYATSQFCAHCNGRLNATMKTHTFHVVIFIIELIVNDVISDDAKIVPMFVGLFTMSQVQVNLFQSHDMTWMRNESSNAFKLIYRRNR